MNANSRRPEARRLTPPPAEKPGLLSRAATAAGDVARGAAGVAGEALDPTNPWSLTGVFGPLGPIHGGATINALSTVGGAIAEGIGSLLGGNN